MKELYDALVKEWDNTSRLMHDITLKTDYDYERFNLLTQYQRGIRFSLDFLEAEAINNFEKAIEQTKEQLI